MVLGLVTNLGISLPNPTGSGERTQIVTTDANEKNPASDLPDIPANHFISGPFLLIGLDEMLAQRQPLWSFLSLSFFQWSWICSDVSCRRALLFFHPQHAFLFLTGTTG